MHILIAAHGFPPAHSGGAERRAERMALWLSANGHQVTVFTVEKLDEPEFRVETAEQDGFTVHRLYYDVKQGNFYKNLYDYPPAGQALRDLLAQESFDLVHNVSGYLLAPQVVSAAHEYGLPVIITLTEYWFMCSRLNLMQPGGQICTGPESYEKCMRCLMEEKRRYRMTAEAAPGFMNTFWKVARHTAFAKQKTTDIAARQEKLRQTLGSADVVICPSHFLQDKFAEFGYDTSRFTFMRQGIRMPPANMPQVERPPAEDLHFGYIGQLTVHKGIDLIVDAMIQLLDKGHKVTLDIWGSQTEEAAYVQMLKERASNYPSIRWHGRYTGDKVYEILAGFDVLLVPSRWYENSPNVILEAYTMKLPVVATNLGGMAEMIQHEKTGLVFALNNTDDLVAQLTRLIMEPERLAGMRANIPAVKTIDEEMHDLVGLYQQLMQAKG